MKILPIEKIREADAYTIEHEPISDLDLMERAALELFEWIAANITRDNKFSIYCGVGNNGGDGFVLARMLSQSGYKLDVFLVRISNQLSPSCQANMDRFIKEIDLPVQEIQESADIPDMDSDHIIIDALFGSGLKRPIEGLCAHLIQDINDCSATVLAVDVPSGFYCDKTNTDNKGAILKADFTLSFQFPKLGFLFPENEQYVGRWEILPIGLHRQYIQDVQVRNNYITLGTCKRLYRSRSPFSHKGTFGHGLIIAGSYGKMGAAVLATKAGLKAGAGLITAHVPWSGHAILQSTIPAAMLSLDEEEKVFTKHPNPGDYTSIAIGPGLGTDEKSQKGLKLLIQNSPLPLIFDADAINILSENKTWIPFIPKSSIFTPHPKEFERLVGPSRDHFERNEMQRSFSIKYQAYVILKGAYTCITTPDGNCWFNSTGNPGMATAGSGDVLTGILLGLMAQGYHPLETCLLGVYLHGLAGDIAVEKWGFEALNANNITHYLGKAFQMLYRTTNEELIK